MPVGRHRAALEKGHVVEWLEFRRGIDPAEHPAERTIHDDTEGTLFGIMGMQ